MKDINITTILLMIFIPFVFVTAIIPIVKKIAEHVGALDIPDKRKVHNKPMPRLGGLGIYAGFLLGYIIFGIHTTIMNSILIGSFVLIITGIIDDIKPLKASHKLVGQILAALIVVFYGGLLLKDVSFFGIYINFGIWAYPITILFILGCINCLNLIDGLDGLAGGISSIFFLTIGIIAYCQGRTGLSVILTFIMFGSTLGFLVHNFNPAKIFMGDSGSMFLGFIIAVITLLGFKSIITSSIIIPLCILIVPILDTICAIIRRKLKGESIGTPDKSHFHHQLLRKNCSVKTTVLIIYLITALFSAASIIWLLVDHQIGYTIYGILMIALMIFVFKTDILFSKKARCEKKNGKNK
ncbi:MAG: undecaprenyl/decaprenyl-phosphate alpha-N-acetylglucosaminyl 1-phosphate transferase [Bacilli bacterium]|nr:undecaprenyl/decaprenyl-phosphate alpha-N-acetylglucosaminyl 1-phosphate transferase [Bacilli bacterium]